MWSAHSRYEPQPGKAPQSAGQGRPTPRLVHLGMVRRRDHTIDRSEQRLSRSRRAERSAAGPDDLGRRKHHAPPCPKLPPRGPRHNRESRPSRQTLAVPARRRWHEPCPLGPRFSQAERTPQRPSAQLADNDPQVLPRNTHCHRDRGLGLTSRHPHDRTDALFHAALSIIEQRRSGMISPESSSVSIFIKNMDGVDDLVVYLPSLGPRTYRCWTPDVVLTALHNGWLRYCVYCAVWLPEECVAY